MPDVTTTYSYAEPTVGASDGTWGSDLNDNFSQLAADIAAIATALNGCLDLAGGTLTGDVKMLTQSWTLVDEGTGLSGTVTLDLDTGNFFALGISGDATIAFSNPPASGDVVYITIEVEGTASLSWPAAVQWPAGAAPTQSGLCVYVLYTRDGGTTWNAVQAMQEMS